MVSNDGIRDRVKTLQSGLRERMSKYRHVESGFKYILLCLYITITLLVLPFLWLNVWILIVLFIISAAVVIGFSFWVSDARDVRVLVVLLAAAAIFERFTLISGKTELRIAGLTATLIIVGMLTVYFFFTVVLARHPIRAHIIWAAITVYLLLGVLYAIAFEIIGTVIAGSVIFNTNPAQVLTTSDYIYYSYSTLFTLSYGDYIPIASFARAMALMEVLIGLFFMGIIIAKLVGYTGLPGYDDKPGDDPESTPENDKQLAGINDRLSRMEQMLAALQDGKKRE